MKLEMPRERGPASRAVLVAVAAGAAAGLALRFARGFPWSLALIVALAVGVFTTMALRSARVLRAVWSRPGEEPPTVEREPPTD